MKALRSLFVAACALTAGSGHAQIPVTDVASIAKSIEQLAAWKQQYGQMLQQIQTAKAQLEATTGRRNLGAVIDNVSTEATVPSAIVEEWKKLNNHERLVKDALGITEGAMRATTLRGEQVRALMQAINSTSDPKAIAEMQARMQAESALITNDLQRVQLLQIQQSAQQQRIEEQYREDARRNLSRPNAKW